MSHKIWSEILLKNNGYKCELSNKKGTLNAHHLNGWHWAISERYDLNNGVVLIESVHRLFHILYGIKHNTKEQFREFTIRFESGEFEGLY
jgi:hypothetical protein